MLLLTALRMYSHIHSPRSVICKVVEVLLVLSHALVLLVQLALLFPLFAHLIILQLDLLIVFFEHLLIFFLVDDVTTKRTIWSGKYYQRKRTSQNEKQQLTEL